MKLGMSPSTFLKRMHALSERLLSANIFRLLKPKPSPVVCMDIAHGKLNGEEVYRWYGKCPYTKIISGWVLSQSRDQHWAERLERMIIRNLGFSPKIWVSDGEASFHSGLKTIYRKIRTVYLGRKPEEGNITTPVARNTYIITREDRYLIVEKGLWNPEVVLVYRDEKGYGRLVSIILHLFEQKKAKTVCVMSKYRLAPFKNFCKRFLYETKVDGRVYHFIGNCNLGNPWAEGTARTIKRRNKWFDNNIRSLDSGRLLFNLQMIIYNVFHRMEELGWKSPFKFGEAEFDGYEDAWKVLLAK